jgi:hypothetical protein
MPQTYGEERRDHRAPDELKVIPEGRLEPRDEEGGKEERDRREDRLLEDYVLASVGLD